MIERYEKDFSKQLNTNIPPHWRVRETESYKRQPTTKRIVAIGGGDNRFRSLLINAIKEAQHTIMLCSFILSDEQIIEEILGAADREVRCYLMFSTETQLKKEYREDMTEFDQKTLDAHKKMLDQLVGKALARTNEHLHAKFLLIDYSFPSQKGFISTANFTYEALTRNQEIGIILTEKEINEVFEFFRFGFWSESNQELLRIRSWDDVKREHINVNNNYLRIRTTTVQNQGIKNEIFNCIKNARGSLIVASYGFDVDHEVAEALYQKAQTNELTIITRPRDRNMPFIEKLSNSGATIFSFNFLHAKFIYAPKEKYGFIMTANIEPRGLDTGYEVGILLNEEDYSELNVIINEWLKHAPLKWEKGGNVQILSPGKILIPNGKESEEKEIILEYSLPIEEESPPDLFKMKKLMESPPRIPEKVPGLLPKVIKVKKIINPPILPKNAVKIDANEYWRNTSSKAELKKKKIKKFPITVYKLKNNYYGIIKSWKEFEKVNNHPDLPKNIIFISE
ncbi:MAG: phosphatidylserine/phosphatidylglycerophosphate/cardiolipin synthase family protein [Promethearchaeota archaeon]